MKKLIVLISLTMIITTACTRRSDENNENKNLKEVKLYLDRMYEEDFKDVTLIKSVKN